MIDHHELWLPVRDFEFTHEVSNLGRVRSKTREVYAGTRAGLRTAEGQILTATISTDGYCRLCLKCDGCSKMKLLHRLVAEAFVANPNSLPYVNHIDFDRQNNAANNLEWCTAKHNVWHSKNAGRYPPAATGKDNKRSRPVAAMTPSGQVVAVYPSLSDAVEAMGRPRGAVGPLSEAIKMGWHLYGYKWVKLEQGA